MPAQERLAQLETNLKRIQGLMSINKAPRYVLVNVPDFVAQAVDHGNLALDTNVVVGKPARATPQVSAKIIEVNFYPTWSVPDIVAQNDLIPAIRRDPNYFYEQHFNVMKDWQAPPLDPASIDWASPQVASYKFRQDPGPQNALGVVRINMPNKHSVYMHDTPLKRLFGQSARAFSSGCVRVEKVSELVAWLLSGQNGWTLEKVEAQRRRREAQRQAAGAGAGAFRLSHRLCRRQRAGPVPARHLWPRFLLRRCRRRPAGRRRRPGKPRGHPLTTFSRGRSVGCRKGDRAPHATPGRKTPP